MLPSWAEWAGPLGMALRVGPVCALAPFFGVRQTPAPIRFALAGCLSVSWGWALPRNSGPTLFDVWVGLSAAGATMLALKSAEAAGRLLDVARGSHHAELVSTEAGDRSSPLGRFSELLGLALFASLHGPARCLAGLRTIAWAPAQLVDLWASCFEAAIALVLPAMMACLMTDLAFGLMARWATRLQAFVLALGPKSLVALLVLASAGAVPWLVYVRLLLDRLGLP